MQRQTLPRALDHEGSRGAAGAAAHLVILLHQLPHFCHWAVAAERDQFWSRSASARGSHEGAVSDSLVKVFSSDLQPVGSYR